MKATVVRKEIDGFAAFLPRIREMDSVEFDEELHQRLARIEEMTRPVPEERPALMKYCFDACSAELDQGEVVRQMRQKPFGYAGDFLLMDWIYQQKMGGGGGNGIYWDMCFHRVAAVRALLWRKQLFGQVLRRTSGVNGHFSGMSIACGPCRDVCEFLPDATAGNGARFHCIDLDERAVEYAGALVESHGLKDRVVFEVKNALLLRKADSYNMVWCGGLLDYLNDRQAASLLRRMWSWTNAGGQAVAGNSLPANPSRNLMEWCGDWILIHRTEDDMRSLCKQAGVPASAVDFQLDPQGCNGYLVISRA